MPDLQQTIKGLKEMLDESKYNDSVQYNPWADTETLEAAIDLLKAQGPRIMSLAEAKNADSVWLEDIDKEAVVPAICFGSIDHADEHRRTGFMARYGRYTFKSICPRDDDYMVRWRAWTAEPSSAQREATPWQK